MGLCSLTCLKTYCVAIGAILVLVSVAGIGLNLFLVFGDPLQEYTYGTYSPNWEDIGPAMISAIVSLLINVALIGGAKQYSKNIVLMWIVWNVILIIVFWVWYGYNQLKHYGYVEWSGMRNCYFCGLDDEETYVGFGGALASVILIVVLMPVGVFHSKLKKRHRELTEPSYELAPNQYMHSVQLAPHHQYNRYISETKMYHDPNQVATRYQMDPYAAARASIQANPYAQQHVNTQWNY